MGISIADFNNDGWPDIFIANDTEPNSLFLNRKNGTFEEQGLERGVAFNDSGHTGSSMGSDAKDFDNDGNVDIFYNNLAVRCGICCATTANCSNTRFSPKCKTLSLPFAGWSNGFIDYNNDGWKDIYSSNGDVEQVNEKSGATRYHVRECRRKDVRRCFQ
ncbi:MAG: VCBS repeat-containing protein [Ignavibacteriota bacterium]